MGSKPLILYKLLKMYFCYETIIVPIVKQICMNGVNDIVFIEGRRATVLILLIFIYNLYIKYIIVLL